MLLIRSHRFTGPIAAFLAVTMVVTLMPVSIASASAAAGTPTTVLLFPAVDNSGSGVADLAEMATNKIYASVSGVEGMVVNEFDPSSPLVRRARSEDRLLSIHMQAGVGDVAGAIEVGYELGMEAILLATVKSVDVHNSARYLTVTLTGEYYEVAPNYDQAAGQPVVAPEPMMAFEVTGASRPRANYTGSDRPLIREALDDAAAKFAQVVAGTPVSKITARREQPERGNKWKWLGPLLLLGVVALAVSNSGGGEEGIAEGATAPRPDHVEVDFNAIRLFWDPPLPTELILLRYQIQRSIEGGPWGTIDGGSCGGACTTWPDFDVAEGNTYRYRIRAVYTNTAVSAWAPFDAVIFTGD